jgi:hypothetical protein
VSRTPCPWCGGPVAPTKGAGHPRTFCDRVCARASREYYRQLPGWQSEISDLEAGRKATPFARAQIALLETYVARKGQR